MGLVLAYSNWYKIKLSQKNRGRKQNLLYLNKLPKQLYGALHGLDPPQSDTFFCLLFQDASDHH